MHLPIKFFLILRIKTCKFGFVKIDHQRIYKMVKREIIFYIQVYKYQSEI